MKVCSKDLVLDEKGVLLPHHSKDTGVGEKGLKKTLAGAGRTTPCVKKCKTTREIRKMTAIL